MKERGNKMSNTVLAAITMQFYAYVNDEGVVEMVLSLPPGLTDPHYVEISENDQSLVGKKLLYYALLDDRDVVTGLIAVANELTDPKKIQLATYNKQLVGKWYNRTTKQFTELPIHILAKLSTKEINLVNADGTPQDKWLQTKLDEIDTKVAQVESTCIADTAAKYNTLDTRVSQVQSTCLTDSAVKYNALNAKLAEVNNGSFGGYKVKFKIEHNEQITADWVNNGIRLTFNFDTGISGYFPKMIRLVTKSASNGFMKADFYIVKNADGSIRHSYVDKSYISRADTTGKTIEEYGGDMTRNSLFITSLGSDNGASYFFGTAPSGSFEVSVGQFSYTENTLSFTISPDKAWVNRYTYMNFNAFVY